MSVRRKPQPSPQPAQHPHEVFFSPLVKTRTSAVTVTARKAIPPRTRIEIPNIGVCGWTRSPCARETRTTDCSGLDASGVQIHFRRPVRSRA